MHLNNPTVFVKNGIKRTAYFTVEAREFQALGWAEESEAEEAKPVKAQEKSQARPKPVEKIASKLTAIKKSVTQPKPSEGEADE
jgi:hypothetical protein